VPAIPLVDAIAQRADELPDAPAITCGDRSVTRAEFVHLTDVAAARLVALGVPPAGVVGMSGPNSVGLLMLAFAIWKAGAVPLPLADRKPADQLGTLLAQAGAGVAVGFPDAATAGRPIATPTLDELFAEPNRAGACPDRPLAPMLRIAASGGSTGISKLIAIEVPALINPARPWHKQMEPDGTHVVPLDVVDGTGFVASTAALGLGCHQVLMESFAARPMLELIERHRADWLAATQPVMLAVAKLADEARRGYDVGSLRAVSHYAGRTADWIKRIWIDWLGPERVWETYGAADSRGSTWIDGVTWLERPGSAGTVQPGGEIAIFDDHDQPVPPGTVGHIYLRDLTGRRNSRYLDRPTPSLPGGWETVGDLGSLDADGYLYVLDRAGDMIRRPDGLRAPLDIEAALEFAPAVRSAVVVGIPGADGFDRVHAVVDTAGAPLDVDAVTALMAEHFPAVLVPDSFEQVDEPLRDIAGKAQRGALRAARS
jgi:bile acid-coenzyme A ligase